LKDVLFVPLECVHSDSITYVYKKTANGVVKQEVIIDVANDENVVIKYGLKEGEELFLTIPDNPDKLVIVELPKKEKAAHEKEIADAKQEEKEAAIRRQKKMEVRMKEFDGKVVN
jgi:uncharacterized protein YqfA (UPF0365 family)